MFPNLRAELARISVSYKTAASNVGVSPQTFRSKMSGRTEFTLSEMLSLRSSYFQGMSIDYLFETKITA